MTKKGSACAEICSLRMFFRMFLRTHLSMDVLPSVLYEGPRLRLHGVGVDEEEEDVEQEARHGAPYDLFLEQSIFRASQEHSR